MGSSASKTQERERELARKQEIDNFLLQYMPLFLETHCNLEESAYMDPMQFWIGFQSYLYANNILNFPSGIHQVCPEWTKYYFHKLNKNDKMYITGSARYNVLVGVSIKKWPGKSETDMRPLMLNELRTIAKFPI